MNSELEDSDEQIQLTNQINALPLEIRTKFISLKMIDKERQELVSQHKKKLELLKEKYEKQFKIIDKKRYELIVKGISQKDTLGIISKEQINEPVFFIRARVAL